VWFHGGWRFLFGVAGLRGEATDSVSGFLAQEFKALAWCWYTVIREKAGKLSDLFSLRLTRGKPDFREVALVAMEICGIKRLWEGFRPGDRLNIGSGVKSVLRPCKGLWRGFNFTGSGIKFRPWNSGEMKMSAVVYAD
jgi:hypothetical protein